MKTALNNKYLLGTHLNGKRILGMGDKDHLIYREIEKQATGTDIVLTDSKRDTGKITRVEGNSTQVVTVQGKNLFDKNKQTTNMTIDLTNGNVAIPATDRNTSNFISILSVSSYTCNTVMTRIAFFDSNKAFINSYTSLSTVTSPSNAKYMKFSYNNTVTNVQLEQGNAATAYTPFVPNSPSPDYISPVVSSADNGLTIRSSSATGTSDKVVTLPTGFVGGKLPNGTMDTLEPISNVMNAVKRIGKVVLNGSESWTYYSALNTTNYSCFYITISAMGGTVTGANQTLSSSHFKDVTWNNRTVDNSGCWQNKNDKTQLFIHVPNTITTVAQLQTWLASNYVTVYYELATPVYTPISDIKIDTYPNNTITSLSSVKPNMTVKYYEK